MLRSLVGSEMCIRARVDIVSLNAELMIIEVELIEPSLYFNMDESSAAFFAKCLPLNLHNYTTMR